VFRHLHALALRFHLERQTGGMSRDIERGTRGISFLLNFMLFNILPTLVEIALVAAILLKKYSIWFAVITFATLVVYIAFTLIITEWRMIFRRTMNEMDSKANTRAIDSLLNYETVKYFSNEEYETRRYDENLQVWEKAAVKNQTSLAALNAGQSAIIAVGVMCLMLLAGQGVVDGTMTLGDLVLVNAFMLQIYMPLHFLGFVYREIKHSLADMEKMFSLLEQNTEIQDKPGAQPLKLTRGEIRFEHVDFSYQPDREILFDVSFDIPAGHKVAVVGPAAPVSPPVAPAVPLLRRQRRAHPDRRPGHPRGHAAKPACSHRHRAAGHRAVQRQHLLQHRLRPAHRYARGNRGGGARGAHPRLHRIAAGRV